MYTAVIVVVTAIVVHLLTLFVRQFSRPEKRMEHQIDHLYGVRDRQFRRSLEGILSPPFMEGNRITPLNNGDEIFPAMLGAIRSARTSINLETYIYWSGRIAEDFAHALIDKANEGVRVRVLLDWFGSKPMDRSLIQRMQEAGIDVELYHPPRWINWNRLNNRTHRKILVVDGRHGFTGGVGIADEWTGHAQDPDHWRDIHFKVEGPCVALLQNVFMDNWLKTHDRVLHGDEQFPSIEPAGDCPAQVFKNSILEGSQSTRLMYLLALTCAEKGIQLSMAYFVPDALSIRTLSAAALRGVRVEIIVPNHHIDKAMVRKASRAKWGEMLEAGVQIHEFQPTMFHNKVTIVDDYFVSVGSANFDPRSFTLNDEVSINVFDRELARRLHEVFEADKQRSQRITYEEWRNRGPWERTRDWFWTFVQTQL